MRGRRALGQFARHQFLCGYPDQKIAHFKNTVLPQSRAGALPQTFKKEAERLALRQRKAAGGPEGALPRYSVRVLARVLLTLDGQGKSTDAEQGERAKGQGGY